MAIPREEPPGRCAEKLGPLSKAQVASGIDHNHYYPVCNRFTFDEHAYFPHGSTHGVMGALIHQEIIMNAGSARFNPSEIAFRYIAVWNEMDPQQRSEQIKQLFSPAISYIDPLTQALGHDELNNMISAARSQFSGLSFNVFGKQDGHHDVIRFAWSLGVDKADPLACGTDIAWLTPDGRIEKVLGFIDKMPS